jgi:hypothetical protein
MLKCLPHCVSAQRENTFMRDIINAQLLQSLNSTSRQWHVAAVAIFRQGQMSNAKLEMDVFPSQVQQFPTPHGSLYGEYDQRPEQGSPPSVTGVEQALLLALL